MKISERLSALASLVSNNKIITDVGSDHCYLLIYLALNKKLMHGYAIENKSEPLIISQKNIAENKINDKITVIFNDGIKKLNYKNDIIIISGLGCGSIIKILEENFNWYKNQQLILCPSDYLEVYNLRSFLHKNSLFIKNEILVEENSYFYIVFNIFYRQGNNQLEITDKEIYLGNYLIDLNDKQIKNFFNNQLAIIEKSIKYNPDHKKLFDQITKLIEKQ